MGKRLGQARTQAEANAGTAAFDLPSYTTAKLMAYWRLRPTLNLSLDVDNVFNKVHYTSSYCRVWVAAQRKQRAKRVPSKEQAPIRIT